MKKITYPFTAIVGQDDFKLALLLNCIDPSIGGVLAVGDKGTGKTTLIRSLAGLMENQEDFPFVNLPIGASEDRVLGHIHLEKLINDKKEQVVPGLLSKANKGCLYIDEVNLLNDYLMDSLLDAAASGGYYLEREGLSVYLESRFCLIGSMNPEEGSLRPQLQDRFGLSVQVKTNLKASERLQIIKNRLAFDDDAPAFVRLFFEQEQNVYHSIKAAIALLHGIKIDEAVYEEIVDLVLNHQVEGHRADILLLKTARAYTAYVGDTLVTVAHVQLIKDLVLNHRSNNDKANPESDSSPSQEEQPQENQSKLQGRQQVFESVLPNMELKKSSVDVNEVSKDSSAIGNEQGTIKKAFATQKQSVDIKKTVCNYIATDRFELQHKAQAQPMQRHLIFLLDSSGSMLKDKVIAYAKGVVQKIADQEKGKNPLFSLVSISNNKAEVLARKLKSTKEFTLALNAIETGGKTDVVAAFKAVKEIIRQDNNQNQELIMVTDGKFTSEEGNAFDQAVLGFKMYCKSIQHKRVIDAERGGVKLAFAQKFAYKISADYEPLLY
ncbi:AAA family ATPase [Flavobacterium sp. 7A]|uniref:AAA family ATPase n=1 Tax=Flavobacterium sp. 7A TaxID=2940571 RepID=UPI00222638D8|nr:AAA family ATPase [Flavobacterium sp. 7A]MCW2119681.1 magnesium chelatase subunit D [Flavobacterium sp. 7A]